MSGHSGQVPKKTEFFTKNEKGKVAGIVDYLTKRAGIIYLNSCQQLTNPP